jgi:hypothetical protein
MHIPYYGSEVLFYLVYEVDPEHQFVVKPVGWYHLFVFPWYGVSLFTWMILDLLLGPSCIWYKTFDKTPVTVNGPHHFI